MELHLPLATVRAMPARDVALFAGAFRLRHEALEKIKAAPPPGSDAALQQQLAERARRKLASRPVTRRS